MALQKSFVILGVVCSLSLTGCLGGGSSSSGGSGDTAPGDSDGFTGLVTDPPIEGASVRLVSAEGNTVSQVVRTDEQGRFELDADARDHWRDGARLLARGGVDSRTGQDFRSFTLAAPFGPDTPEEPVVSPLTTLVDHHLNHSAMGYEAALERVATQVGLTPDQTAALVADPAEHPRAQQASLLTADLLAALRGTETPWATLAQALDGANGDFAQAAQWLQMDELPEAVQHRLSRFEHRAEHLQDMAPGNAEAAIRAHGQANLHDGLAAFLERAHGLSDSDARQWGHALAEPVWSGMGDKSLPADAPALLNVGRYLLQHHLPETLDLEQLPEQAIATDTTLRELASRRVIDPTIPLGVGETLGMDNTARIHYFLRSEHAPYYRAERLFDDVFDDATTDPVFASIAHGMASAGLVDEAVLALRSRVFQPTERAEAHRLIGDALIDSGDDGTAFEQLVQARATYEDILQSKGIANLEDDDAQFLARLSGTFSRAGHPDEVEATLNSVRQFTSVAGGKNKDLTMAYRQIALAAYDAAREAVERYELNGNAPALRNQAESALSLAQELIWGLGPDSVPFPGLWTGIDRKYSTRTQYVAQYGQLAVRLGLDAEATRSVNEFAELLSTPQNLDAAGLWLTNMAEVFDYLDRMADYEALIAQGESLNGEGDWSRAASPRAELALFSARQQALQGQIEQAIETTLEARADPGPSAQVRDLTYDLISREVLQPGGPRLALYLVEQGELDAARQVVETAAEIALSGAMVAERVDGSNDWQFVYLGCRRVAFMYDLAGDTDKAMSHLNACADRVNAEMSGSTTPTAEQAESVRLLAAGHLWLDDQPGAENRLAHLASVGQSFSGTERIAHLVQRAELLSQADSPEQALQLLNEAAASTSGLTSGSSSEESTLEALEWATRGGVSQARGRAANNGVASAYGLVAEGIRERATTTGTISAARQTLVTDARAQAQALILGGDNDPGVLGLIDTLPNEQDRDTETRHAVNALVAVRGFEPAAALASADTRSTVRNRLLQSIANGLTEWDDFPGSFLARFDFDGDGRPDFFSPGSTLAEREASPLTLDNDIDGDSIPDFQDRTPYCPADTAGCWNP
ncbi:hypothetical protein [Alkalilimnicola ehrlichii]|uniref:hypothetical protein n=1 Tax=Alkalilimnicola ehrlichii TaxID=351052 RepID=UPI003BA38731